MSAGAVRVRPVPVRALEVGAALALLLALALSGAAGYSYWRYHQRLDRELREELDLPKPARDRLLSLLRRGANPNAVGPGSHESVLTVAATRSDQDLAAEVLQCGGNVNRAVVLGRDALHEAAYRSKAAFVRFLLDHGADLEARDGRGMTPLMHAAAGDRAETVELLLHRGATVEVREYRPYGDTPLMAAAAWGSYRAVKVLLQHGANCNARDFQGKTALDYVRSGLRLRPECTSQYVRVARLLREPHPSR